MKKLFCVILLLMVVNVGHSQFLDSEPMFGQQLNLGHWSTDGLVFYWRGIQAGQVVDESFYRNHGTITDAVWEGEGLTFNGSSAVVATAKAIPIGQTYTFIWRQRVDSTTGERQPFGLDAAAQFHSSNGSLVISFYDGTFLTGSASDVIGQWSIRAFVGTPSSRALYRNGILDAEDGTAAYDYGGICPLDIGRRKGLANWWNGGFSGFKIYNRALSAEEILGLYLNPDLPMQQAPIWLMYSPVVGGSLQQILNKSIGPSVLGGSVVR